MKNQTHEFATPSGAVRAAAVSTAGAVSDLVIVGAGIIGLAHAAHAVANGLTVTVLERDHHAVGASVRNFGHCCITAQSGELYELAQASRKYWLEFARQAGFWAAESGAVVLARTAAEMAVLEELAAVREPGQVELLSAEGTRSRLAGASDGPGWPGLLGGAFLRDDLRVDPRTTAARLAAWLERQPGVEIRWNTSALGFGRDAAGTVTATTSRGEVRGRQVLVCVGHDVDYLFPELAAEHRIERCALQMSLAGRPAGLDLAPAVLTATSMLRYPAFTEMPAAAALRAEIRDTRPDLLDIGANVMFTQRPDGSLILGDSHHYHRTATPFLDEPVTATLNHEIAQAIGAELDIIQRWQGVYASSDVGPLLEHEVQPGVTVISVTSGVGMTLSFGLAHRTISRLF
ncbi:TIGR03364 family FAD-dependent oxidoreductase [Arthrobacter oryzae]|uniref:TIGR03364 family FAD-dependent oxidoreductase n=1 Tax=Arthrobacter oryzae TaxID=409290 RepID=UPI002865C428|nr:TIGR03364 family FAD-dependent oxidoreductase [Arthrobacter oryzae]MDR6508548.1 FAD dependent oxidoreductase TIGR03364 [Arthrobacter oryzae]